MIQATLPTLYSVTVTLNHPMKVKCHFKKYTPCNIVHLKFLIEVALEMLQTSSIPLSVSCIHSISFAKHIGGLLRDTKNGCITERLSVSNC